MDNGERDDPTNLPSDQPATWKDIMHLPEAQHAEIIGGQIHYKAMARARHGHTLTELSRRLPSKPDVDGRGGWWILLDVDICLDAANYVKPDISGWRMERLPELPDQWPVQTLPDWVCEVLSPTTSAYDRGKKATAYAQAGVLWYWIVDPIERTVEVLELVNDRWTICGVYTDGAQLALPPFDQTVLAIEDLFAPVALKLT